MRGGTTLSRLRSRPNRFSTCRVSTRTDTLTHTHKEHLNVCMSKSAFFSFLCISASPASPFLSRVSVHLRVRVHTLVCVCTCVSSSAGEAAGWHGGTEGAEGEHHLHYERGALLCPGRGISPIHFNSFHLSFTPLTPTNPCNTSSRCSAARVTQFKLHFCVIQFHWMEWTQTQGEKHKNALE